jgi:hypothetical protein
MNPKNGVINHVSNFHFFLISTRSLFLGPFDTIVGTL